MRLNNQPTHKPRRITADRPGNGREFFEPWSRRHGTPSKPDPNAVIEVPWPAILRVLSLKDQGYRAMAIAAQTRFAYSTVEAVLAGRVTPTRSTGGTET